MKDIAGNDVYSYNTHSFNKSLYQSINASTDYQHTFAEDRRITLSYRYDYSPQGTKAETANYDMQHLPDNYGLRDLKTDPDQLSYEHTAQVDFTTPLDKKHQHTLSVCAKYIDRINRSNSKKYTR